MNSKYSKYNKQENANKQINLFWEKMEYSFYLYNIQVKNLSTEILIIEGHFEYKKWIMSYPNVKTKHIIGT